MRGSVAAQRYTSARLLRLELEYGGSADDDVSCSERRQMCAWKSKSLLYTQSPADLGNSSHDDLRGVDENKKQICDCDVGNNGTVNNRQTETCPCRRHKGSTTPAGHSAAQRCCQRLWTVRGTTNSVETKGVAAQVAYLKSVFYNYR